MNAISRRRLAPLAGFAIVPRHVLGEQAHKPPGEKLNIAGVGVGGVCANYLRNCETENITATRKRAATATFASCSKRKRASTPWSSAPRTTPMPSSPWPP